MANQLKMADLQSLYALHRAGWSARRIARELNIDRETVGRYLRAAESKPATEAPAGKTTGISASLVGVPALSDPGEHGSPAVASPEADPKPASEAPAGESAALALADNAGPAGEAPAGIGAAGTCQPSAASQPPACSTKPAGSRSGCESFRAVIQAGLDAGLTAQRIYQDLVAEHAYEGSYYSVRRLARKLSAALPLPMRRMECEPGAEAQVDFGRGAWIVGADGKRRGSWVFRIVLSHSRKGYSEAVFRQTADAFLLCLENAFNYFGGAARALVLDNLTPAVKHPDWYDPELSPKMRSFGEHYGIAILPTRPRMPRHKGKIERGIGYVKGNALKQRCFASLAEQNRHLLEWESSVADQRIHGTTRKHVGQLFEAAERGALLPLPPGRFEMFSEGLRGPPRRARGGGAGLLLGAAGVRGAAGLGAVGRAGGARV